MRQRGVSRRRAATGLGVLALLVAGVVPAAVATADGEREALLGTAEDFGLTPQAADRAVPTGAWFVQLSGPPTYLGGSEVALAEEHARFVREAEDLGVEVQLRQQFTSAWNGVSVRAQDGDVGALAQVSGVVGLYPVLAVAAPEPVSDPGPQMPSALEMTGAAAAQDLGHDGSGVSVAIIGTGVDYDHPELGGQGTDGATPFPTGRVTHGADLVGDTYDAGPSSDRYQPVPEPDDDPDDCNGQGTHVAGVVAGETTGVAPAATLGAYRVFGCEGSADSDVILAAMEQAAEDGMDVLTLPPGEPFTSWPDYPIAAAADTLVDAGVVVVAPMGDSGEHGTWSAGAPGVSQRSITVASVENTGVVADAFRLAPGGELVAHSPAAGAAPAPTEGRVRVSLRGRPGSAAAEGCSRARGVARTVLLVARGSCTFFEKAYKAQEAGASALVIYNTEPGLFSPTVAGDTEITIPVVAVSQEDGLAMAETLASGALDLSWTDEQVQGTNPDGGLVSSFSGYGLTADLQLKPDVGAPGGQIRSLYPVESGGYATMSGSSMAASHVAGAAALLLQARPDLDAEEVRTRLQNTADPLPWALSPAAGTLEPVHRQGAGLLDLDDALAATTTVRPSALSLGESDAGPVTRTLTLSSTAAQDITFDVTVEHGVATRGTVNPSFYDDPARVEAPESVTVPAGGSLPVEITVSRPEHVDLGVYGGYLVLTPSEGAPLRVPFAGMSGDYQELPAMTDTPGAGPTLARLDRCDRLLGVDCVDPEASWRPAEPGEVFSMAQGDVPTMLLHLEHPVEELSFRLYRATADGGRGTPVGPDEYVTVGHVGRDGGAFTPWTWDGTLQHADADGQQVARAVPDGDYVIEVSALRALGDPDNPRHVETWTTPAFTIERTEPAGEAVDAAAARLGAASGYIRR